MNITHEYQRKILNNILANRIQHLIKYIMNHDQRAYFRMQIVSVYIIYHINNSKEEKTS